MIKIFGKVTDFSGNPIENAEIDINDKHFETIYQTFSGEDGKYSLSVNEGTYIAMFVCKNYKKENLEYWAWNIPAYSDLEINTRIDGLEVYAMNAWVPQGAVPSFQIYFRPMSLKRTTPILSLNNLTDIHDIVKIAPELVKMQNVIDIAPELSEDDIILKIDEELMNVLEINKVREFAGKDQSIFGYLIQSNLPVHKTGKNYHKICLTIRDAETKEQGEACLFWKEPQYV